MRFFIFCVSFFVLVYGDFISGSNSAMGQSEKPNIILLNLDDADAEMLSAENIEQHFPAISELFQRATVFSNAHCTTPFCAPSRAALMSGKYGFNNGCKTGTETSEISAGFDGGYQCFKRNGHDEEELGVWMKRAGYRTMHVGKFHHDGFDFTTPPGWDDFSVSLGAKYFGTARFSNVNRNTTQFYNTDDDRYIAHEELEEALDMVNNQVTQRPAQPFFLYLAPFAPHSPQGGIFSTMVEPKYSDYEEGLLQPTDVPDYDEADLSDKVEFLQRGPLTEREKIRLQDLFIHRLRALKSVDDMVGEVVDRLKRIGEWENSYFFLTSDNGFSMGHHRILFKKEPYQRGSNIPMFAVAPSSVSKKEGAHLIAHLDLCPTILELAGGDIPDDVDGKSFASLIDNPESADPVTWQRSIMLENWANKYVGRQMIPMAYTAERFFNKVHIAWANGHHEYYLLENDPFQLDSTYDRLNDFQRNFLNNSLLRFRQRNARPEITLTSPISGDSVGPEISFAGFMEDNSSAVLAELVVQSFATKRFFNGRTWQDDYVAIPVPANSLSSNITSWNMDLEVFTETQNNLDFLVTRAIPTDDSMRTGPIDFTVNSLEDHSIFAAINPTIARKTFQTSTQVINGALGRFPNQRVNLSIVDTDSFRFFNGEELQDGYVALNADSQTDEGWEKSLNLPPGNYRCYAQAFVRGLYQSDASIVDFSVE